MLRLVSDPNAAVLAMRSHLGVPQQGRTAHELLADVPNSQLYDVFKHCAGVAKTVDERLGEVFTD